jgi:hypothetical protein
VEYDPSLVEAPVKTIGTTTEFIEKGNQTFYFGFDENWEHVGAKIGGANTATYTVPVNATDPHYRATIFKAISVEIEQAYSGGFRVLSAEDSDLQALWLPCRRADIAKRQGHHASDRACCTPSTACAKRDEKGQDSQTGHPRRRVPHPFM